MVSYVWGKHMLRRERPRLVNLLLVVLANLLLVGVDGKGGGFGRVRRSTVRPSTTAPTRSRTPASTNPYYRGHPEPSRPCVGCYYSSGMYYDRTFMFMYLGMAYQCTSCAERSNADVDSLEISLPAITAVAAVDLNSMWYTNEVLTAGSAEFASFAAELSEVISELTDDAIPPPSCLVTKLELMRREGLTETELDEAELHVDAHVTILLEAEDVDAALVVEKLQKNCASGTTWSGTHIGHWELPHCLTTITTTNVELTSALGDTPIPVRTTNSSGSGLGYLLLSMVTLALVAWCCASCVERRAELAMHEPSGRDPKSRRVRQYDQLPERDFSDNSGDSDEGDVQTTERLQLSGASAGRVVDVQAVVHAVAVPASHVNDNASDWDTNDKKQREVTATPRPVTVSTGFQ